jgi:hypothetical protein
LSRRSDQGRLRTQPALFHCGLRGAGRASSRCVTAQLTRSSRPAAGAAISYETTEAREYEQRLAVMMAIRLAPKFPKTVDSSAAAAASSRDEIVGMFSKGTFST